MDPLIVNINENSLDDGPGIRTVVFLKGCSLRCAWCQNPETQLPEYELMVQPEKCTHCPTCYVACQLNALIIDANTLRVDRGKCNLCFQCIEGCPFNVFVRAGKTYTIEELVRIALQNISFYANTGGGVTLSGGEPLFSPSFIRQLVEALAMANIGTVIETAGLFKWGSDIEVILRQTEVLYYDLKFMDPLQHQKYCGVDNHIILENFSRLLNDRLVELPTTKASLDFRYSRPKKPLLVPRIPLIPDLTTTDENLAALAAFLKQHGVRVMDLLSYNPLWVEKIPKLGKQAQYVRKTNMSTQESAAARKYFEGFEFEHFKSI